MKEEEFKSEIVDDIVKDVRGDILTEQYKKQLRSEIKAEVLKELAVKDEGNFFNRNPLITFALSSIVVIVFFKWLWRVI